jgi:hypothetical protein
VSEAVGHVADIYGDTAIVSRDEGEHVVTFVIGGGTENGGIEASMRYDEARFAEFRELLDRAAMPGQVTTGG